MAPVKHGGTMPVTTHEMFPTKNGSDRAPKSGSNQGGKSGNEGGKKAGKR